MALHTFLLPDVGEGIAEGEIMRWLVAVGDDVAADQCIVEVQTDKAIVELPSPVAGTIVELGGSPGQVLEVGAMLAAIETESVVAPIQASHAPVAAPASAQQASPQNTGRGRARASPATRKLARALGVALEDVTGSGSRGQVTRQDVERAAASVSSGGADAVAVPAAQAGTLASMPTQSPRRAPPPSGADRVEPLTGLRRQIAVNMERAWREIPHIFSFEQIDATALVAARKALNEQFADAPSSRLSYLPIFVKACVGALKAHPRFNATFDMANQQITYRHRYNVGIATATPDGLTVTVVHDADAKSLLEVAEEINTLARLARERKVGADKLADGTFTISNFGSYGGWLGNPIIRPPEVAIAGFGRVHDAVVAVDGLPTVRATLPLVVSTDHRVNDGEHLGEFIATVAGYLREPVRLLGIG